MKIYRYFLISLLSIFLLGCRSTEETAVTPTPLAATVTLAPTSSVVPIIATEPVTGTPQATAVPPTATAISTPPPTPLPTLPTATVNPQALSLENAASLAQIGQFTHGTINDMKWSPDGTAFAVASSTGVQLYDTTSWTITQILDTQAVAGTVHFIPQSNLIAVLVCQETTCHPQIWDSSSAQMVKALPNFMNMSPIFPNGHFIAVEQIDFETVRLHWFDPSGAELPQTVDLPQFPLAHSPDGSTLVTAIDESELGLINSGNGKLLSSLVTGGSPLSAAYSPDSSLLAVGSSNGQTRLWRVADGQLLHTLEGSSFGLAFSPDGRLLATAGENSTIQLWDTASGQLLNTQKGGPRLAFSPDGSELAAAHMGSISFFPLADFELLRSVGEYGQPVEGIAISPDGHTLAAATTSEVQLWGIPSQKLHETIIYSDTSFTGVAFSPDGRILALAGGPPTNLRLWHLDNRELTGEVKDQTTYINSVAFSPDGQLVATADGEQIVKVWNATSLELLFTTPGAEFAFHPNGRILAVAHPANAASGEWQVAVWDLTTLERLHTLAQIGPQIVFRADGRLLAVRCCFDITVWDAASGEMIRHISEVRPFGAVSPNNQLLVSTDYSHALTVWDLETGERLTDLPGHTAGFSERSSGCCIVFSRDGRFFASGSWDGTIRLWGLANDTP